MTSVRLGAIAITLWAACGDNLAAPQSADAPQPPDAEVDARDDVTPDAGPPTLLSQTGLCADVACTKISPDVFAYAPRWALWADAASKNRWIYLPPGTQIDSTNMDTWSFPQGTKLWKEFTSGGTRVETRMFWKQGTDDTTGWYQVAYVWNAAQDTATATPLGEMNANGTQHDVPSQSDCRKCHYREDGRILGFAALQLDVPAIQPPSGPTVVDLDYLVTNNLLTKPPTKPASGPYFPLWPDTNALDTAALGYLHANCGHCHNPTSDVINTCPHSFKLELAQLTSVHATDTYTTTINIPPSITLTGATYTVTPGNPDTSALYMRFTNPDPAWRMPPLATEVIDPTGQQILHDWIAQLQ
jgi:hypothetical protein